MACGNCDVLPPSESTPLLAGDSSSQALVSSPKDDWWSELWLLMRYSLPLIATYLLQYGWCVIITFLAGHLSADDLAAASVGMTTMNIFGFAVFEGMATALDTLCAQAYGSGNLTGVGLHVQRMLILMAFTAVGIAAVWTASPWILALFIKQQHLAVMAGSFLRVSIIGMPGYASFEALKRFLQAQGNFKAAMCILVVCTPVNAFLSWLFAFKLGMGLKGAALGSALTNNLRPTLLLLYIISPAGRWSHKCWGGFSRAALSISKWGPMVKLSVAGSAVNLAEWAAFEIVAFSTSYLSTKHLAAQTVLTTISVVSWHIPFSMSVAISTRIGHLIGAGLVSTARRAAALYGCIFALIGSVDGLIIFALRNHLPRFFSEDPTVCTMATKTMLAVSVFQVIDAFICFTNGTIRGLGRQSFAAWVVIAVNYSAAVPVAIWLELGPSGLELNGVWIGLGSGMVVIAAIECCYMKFLRWHDCVESAKLREG
ncbi:MATE efflux family protein [Xylaria bambusicola]|uniref:MATE efflux family protein n=1 Tax=Xylaria bambusicola TaxID=326684 RepID=UPI002008812C|nr:MATE efflux family protein [Xylaria bambusicola]KAI0522155.1 MATE efflux family protein [Xylaria bambusicola]